VKVLSLPPSLLYNGFWVFPGGKERPGRDSDPSPPSSAVVMKGYSRTFTPPIGRTACTEPQCLYKGALYLLYCLYPFAELENPLEVSPDPSCSGSEIVCASLE